MAAAKKKSAARSKRGVATTTPDPNIALAVAKWRETRAPADADVVDEIGGGDPDWQRRIAAIARQGGTTDLVVERLKSLAELEDDPRLTRAILQWLGEARWPGSGMAEGWSAAFARLVSLRDARAVAPLCKMAKDLPPFVGIKHRDFMTGELARTADALERATAGIEVKKPIVVRTPGATADTMTIIQKVFDAPEDDDLRRVVADQLLEIGDPWGEFIQIGFLTDANEATPEQRRAAETLLKKHAVTFAGPLGQISKSDGRTFEKGFLKRVLTNATMVARPAWEAAARTPYWATVTRLELSWTTTPKWWLVEVMKNSALRNLREMHINHYLKPQISLERIDPTGPWRVVAALDTSEHFLRFLRDLVLALPEAERARVEVAAIPQADIVVQALLDRR